MRAIYPANGLFGRVTGWLGGLAGVVWLGWLGGVWLACVVGRFSWVVWLGGLVWMAWIAWWGLAGAVWRFGSYGWVVWLGGFVAGRIQRY